VASDVFAYVQDAFTVGEVGQVWTQCACVCGVVLRKLVGDEEYPFGASGYAPHYEFD
jgi:hypothetical protein